MASNLRVDTILPSSGLTLGIGTANGTVNFLGNCDITTQGDITITGNLGVGGTITYEDVARVDATGISTFREGFHLGPLAGVGLTAYKDGSIRTSGIITATTYYGSGANLTGIDATQIVTGNTSVQTVDTGSDGHVKVSTEGTERLRINSGGNLGVGINDPSQARLVAQTASGMSIAAIKDNTGASISLGGVTQPRILFESDPSASTFKLYTASGSSYGSPSWSEKLRIASDGKITTSGTTQINPHTVGIGTRTTTQINAGVGTAHGSLTLDTSTNNVLFYGNSQWNTIKKVGNDGSTQTLAARSAKALMDDGITTSGVYWLDMHGGYSAGNAKRHYCLQDSSYDGGGWTMLYAMNHGNNFASGSNYTFSVNVGSPTSAGDFTGSNWGYDRRNTFTPAANDQFLIRRSDNNDWKRFVVSAWSPTSNSVSNGWETLNNPAGSGQGHPFYATGQMYDSSGNSVSGYIYFNGCAKGGNCNSGGGDGSGFGNYQAWLYGTGGYAAYGGGYNGQGAGGSPLYWGTSALSQGGSLYLQMFYRKSGTQ